MNTTATIAPQAQEGSTISMGVKGCRKGVMVMRSQGEWEISRESICCGGYVAGVGVDRSVWIYSNPRDLRFPGLNILQEELRNALTSKQYMRPSGLTNSSSTSVGEPNEIGRLKISASPDSNRNWMSG